MQHATYTQSVRQMPWDYNKISFHANRHKVQYSWMKKNLFSFEIMYLLFAMKFLIFLLHMQLVIAWFCNLLQVVTTWFCNFLVIKIYFLIQECIVMKHLYELQIFYFISKFHCHIEWKFFLSSYDHVGTEHVTHFHQWISITSFF